MAISLYGFGAGAGSPLAGSGDERRPAWHHDAMMLMMRTTLNLPEDVYRAARALAEAKRVSLGEAVAELVRLGIKPSRRADSRKAFPCFTVPENAAPITLEQTLEAEDEL